MIKEIENNEKQQCKQINKQKTNKEGVKMINTENWQVVEGYPRVGDYVKTSWRGKVYEGIVGDKVVRFRSGFVAREITTREGRKIWMPWTNRAKYFIKIA